jgi:hypothetical protein
LAKNYFVVSFWPTAKIIFPPPIVFIAFHMTKNCICQKDLQLLVSKFFLKFQSKYVLFFRLNTEGTLVE